MCDYWRNFFWDAINDFMMGKYSRLLFIILSKRMYEY